MFTRRKFGGRRPQRKSFTGFKHKPKKLDSRLYIKAAQEIPLEKHEIVNSFADFVMDQRLAKNLELRGFTTPTPIQDKTLKPGLSGVDIIGLADTGTGKTTAFALPILNKIISDPGQNALILAPTRELAVQIRDEFRQLSLGLPIYSCLLIGGSSMDRQIADLRRRPHIFVGTPGRIMDLYNRHVLRFDRVRTAVLDEVDRMLDMGFVKDITHIMSLLPEKKQTLLFSATIDEKVEQIGRNFMVSPIKVSVKTGVTSHNVEQDIIKVAGKFNKTNKLKDLLRTKGFERVIVFCRTKYGAEDIAKDLVTNGFKVSSIHGNKSQSQREAALRRFRNGELQALIATDVAARGIDVKDVSHVINFDEPATHADYIHRVGRTGRAGKKGFALTFVD